MPQVVEKESKGFQDGNSPKFCIIGAGFSGICAAVKLQNELNIHNFEMFEMNKDFGGTWLKNCYPGACCDVPIHGYCLTFEARPDWKAQYATQGEILTYLKEVAKKHDLNSRIKFEHKVKRLTWHAETSQWEVIIEDMQSGKETLKKYDFILNASGSLRVPKVPEEFAAFQGPKIHTALWDDSIDLMDKKIAVVGAGASAIQVIPEVAKLAQKLTVYQRTQSWIIPKLDFYFPAIIQWLFKLIPLTLVFFRWCSFRVMDAIWHALRKNTVAHRLFTKMANTFRTYQLQNNEDLIKKLTPNYPYGCRRMLFAMNYYPTFLQPHVQLVTNSIQRVTKNSIVTQEGEEEIDVLILATGFHVRDYFAPMEIFDKNGENVLTNWKKDAPSLLLGVLGNYLPNLFILYGPNALTGHNSVVRTVEFQMDMVIKCLKEMKSRKAHVFTVKKSAENNYMEEMYDAFTKMVWSADSCSPYYADAKGRITALYPGNLQSFRRKVDKFNAADNLLFDDEVM